MSERITSDDSIGKAMSLLATDRMTEALSILRRLDMMTWEELDDLLTVGVFDVDTQRGLFENSRKNRNQGVPWPAMVPGLDVQLRIAVSHSFHIADRLGITSLGSMVFEPHQDIDSFLLYRPSILTANLVEGAFGTMSGLPRQGKTNAGCIMMEQTVQDGMVAISNVLPKTPSDQYRYVNDAKALFRAVADIPAGTKWRFILDEGGLIANKKDAMTKRVKELEGLFRVIGKLEGSLVFIEQRVESVPTILQEWSRSNFFAVKPGVLFMDLNGPNITLRRTVKDFPRTTLPFDTRDIAYFPVNVNTASLFASISGAADQKEAIREFISSGGKSAPVESKPLTTLKCSVCGKEFQTNDGRRLGTTRPR